MGQPTASVAQRSGRGQLWATNPLVGFRERGFSEHVARVRLGLRLAVLFFLSGVVTPKTVTFWGPGGGVHFAYNHPSWVRLAGLAPALWLSQDAYYQEGVPAFLFQDGADLRFGLGYYHRRLRVSYLFWAQPRCVRVGTSVFVLLRGVGVSPDTGVPPRPQSLAGRVAHSQALGGFLEETAATLPWF